MSNHQEIIYGVTGADSWPVLQHAILQILKHVDTLPDGCTPSLKITQHDYAGLLAKVDEDSLDIGDLEPASIKVLACLGDIHGADPQMHYHLNKKGRAQEKSTDIGKPGWDDIFHLSKVVHTWDPAKHPVIGEACEGAT